MHVRARIDTCQHEEYLSNSAASSCVQVLSWIDICAGLAAKTVARGPVVTASLDAVHFVKPCRLGAVAIIAAMVNRTFASSMEVPAPCHPLHSVVEEGQ